MGSSGSSSERYNGFISLLIIGLRFILELSLSSFLGVIWKSNLSCIFFVVRSSCKDCLNFFFLLWCLSYLIDSTTTG